MKIHSILRASLVAAFFALAALQPSAHGAATPAPPPPPGLLSANHTPAGIQRILIPRSQWTPFPRIDDRDAWENKADKTGLAACVQFATQNLDYAWPPIPATLSLAFVRDGNRSRYERISFAKRATLASLLTAELAENKGRFIDPIINGVWSICEESWWGVSAALPRTPAHAGLADTSEPFVDLFAAVTGELLAWTDYFLGEKFDAVSPQIRKRIRNEITTRILRPVMTKTAHHWWMGDDPGRALNNWTPWICSNWLVAALLVETDEAARAAHVARILTVLDRFLATYPRDGGCDEGPNYWNVAAGSLYDNLAMLNLATNGAFKHVFSDEKIQNMGKYIYRVQISDKTRHVVSFADSPPQARVDGPMVWRFGKDTGDEGMTGFAAANPHRRAPSSWSAHYARDFFNFFTRAEFEAATPRPPLPRDVWFADLQVAAARDKGGSDAGFYFAAKGGHNSESHNHNDIGNFIVYYDGQPVLIDAGQGTYTARTFDRKQRYTLWNNNSDHHNVPSINGVAQSAGGKYKALSADFRSTENTAVFFADIAPAYPEAAGVSSWRRTITLDRGRAVTVRDEADLKKTDGGVIQRLLTCHPAKITAPGEVTITGKDGAGKDADFVIKFTGADARIEIEKVSMEAEDYHNIRTLWGDAIHRISFIIAAPGNKDAYVMEITKR